MKNIGFLEGKGVNVDKGLDLLGDVDTYNEMLREFQINLPDKLAEIKKTYNEEDMPNYAILVHSLKSDCKYFGFMKLAEIAYHHEMQSKANNLEYVKTNYNKIIAEAENVMSIIADYFEEAEVLIPIILEDESEEVILVADDSELIRVFVRKIFDNKFKLEFAQDGEEALNIIKKYQNEDKIKAILLDLNMPKTDGFAVLDYLQKNNLLGMMPVTIISGDSSTDAINKAFSYEIVDMINKPFNENKIKHAIEKMLKK